ncbi:hypothetical protein ACF0H5_017674 [Mactra antiquata]
MATKVDRKDSKTTDWRHKKPISQCLSYLSEHKMWHDVTFTFSGKLLHAHRLLLSLRSPVFEAMFYGPAADKNEVIEISDIEYDVFDCLLRYMYTDECKLTGDNVLPILYGAKKYCLSELVDRCSIFLEDSVTYDNVCALYERAKMYDMDSLVKSCFDLMIKDSSAVCKSDSSVCLSHESLLEFLSREHLTGGELEHFRFVNKWADQKCLSNGMESNPGNKREVLGDIVKKISYQFIKAEDFARVVVPTNILSPEEQSQIFQYIATRDRSCIEKFSLPPRQGFPITINTTFGGCSAVNEESFCFQFCCNTNVRLVKLFPIKLGFQGSIRDFGKKDVEAVKVNITNPRRRLFKDQNIPLDVLDESAAIKKDIGFTFEAHETYFVKILLRPKPDDYNVVVEKFPRGYAHGSKTVWPDSRRHREPAKTMWPGTMPLEQLSNKQKPHSIATLNPGYTYTDGSFSCIIEKIPQCVEVVEFKILP